MALSPNPHQPRTHAASRVPPGPVPGRPRNPNVLRRPSNRGHTPLHPSPPRSPSLRTVMAGPSPATPTSGAHNPPQAHAHCSSTAAPQDRPSTHTRQSPAAAMEPTQLPAARATTPEAGHTAPRAVRPPLAARRPVPTTAASCAAQGHPQDVMADIKSCSSEAALELALTTHSPLPHPLHISAAITHLAQLTQQRSLHDLRRQHLTDHPHTPADAQHAPAGAPQQQQQQQQPPAHYDGGRGPAPDWDRQQQRRPRLQWTSSSVLPPSGVTHPGPRISPLAQRLCGMSLAVAHSFRARQVSNTCWALAKLLGAQGPQAGTELQRAAAARSSPADRSPPATRPSGPPAPGGVAGPETPARALSGSRQTQPSDRGPHAPAPARRLEKPQAGDASGAVAPAQVLAPTLPPDVPGPMPADAQRNTRSSSSSSSSSSEPGPTSRSDPPAASHHPQPLQPDLELLFSQASRHWDGFTGQELSNLLYAVAVLQHPVGQPWLRRCMTATSALLHEMSPQAVSNVLWALATVSVSGGAGAALVQSAIGPSKKQFQAWKEQQWQQQQQPGEPGEAHHHTPPPSQQAQQQAQQQEQQQPAQQPDQSCRDAVSTALQDKGQRWGGSMDSSVNSGLPALSQPQSWLDDMFSITAPRLADFPPESCAVAAWALAKLQVQPSLAWRRGAARSHAAQAAGDGQL
ncbi:MAG: hypothetical protein WDW38_010408 [Sanguina aurantia]